MRVIITTDGSFYKGESSIAFFIKCKKGNFSYAETINFKLNNSTQVEAVAAFKAIKFTLNKYPETTNILIKSDCSWVENHLLSVDSKDPFLKLIQNKIHILSKKVTIFPIYEKDVGGNLIRLCDRLAKRIRVEV